MAGGGIAISIAVAGSDLKGDLLGNKKSVFRLPLLFQLPHA